MRGGQRNVLNSTMRAQSGKRQIQKVGNYEGQMTWFLQQIKVMRDGEGGRRRNITNAKGL